MEQGHEERRGGLQNEDNDTNIRRDKTDDEEERVTLRLASYTYNKSITETKGRGTSVYVGEYLHTVDDEFSESHS